ncbi:MAG: malto-oligosyltrehalose trehalohydrolase, partial [Chitinispirillaceae bacterium]
APLGTPLAPPCGITPITAGKNMDKNHKRSFPVGAEPVPGGGVSFRIWAPEAKQVKLVLVSGEGNEQQAAMTREGNGYFSTSRTSAGSGMRYGFRLGEKEKILPDPASRFQPEGIFGLSRIVDPGIFEWEDEKWPGPDMESLILYEMHIGTFTGPGTYRAAAEQLGRLSSLGITAIELMPVAEFDGSFGWGYDGVFQFAPTRLYGTPDDFRIFVNEAHRCGLGVILDVVYNHLGPGSWLLDEFSPYYFSSRYKNEWGKAINFDDRNAGPVREYFLSNARCWAREFHIDGLRIDATQQIFDSSGVHIIKEVADTFREAAAPRRVVLVGESEPQDTDLIMSKGLDCLWNDDFHRSATVTLTGRKEGYYSDYSGSPQELISAVKYGYLFQGQYYSWQGKKRGSLSGTVAHRLVHYLQNHDQVANSCRGKRINQMCSPAKLRAMTVLLILGPQVPLLFQGQEFASSSPFYYFASRSDPELEKRSARGRAIFLSQFPSVSNVNGPLVPEPADPECFMKSKINPGEAESHWEWYRLHADLISLRHKDRIFRYGRFRKVDGAVLEGGIALLRYSGINNIGDRILVVNLGRDRYLPSVSEPLAAAPPGTEWKSVFYSEDPLYGGGGVPSLNFDESWYIAGQTAYYLKSV